MAGKMDARQNIVGFARTLVGSHYLWGSTGGAPNMGGGSLYRQSEKGDLLSVDVTIARPSLEPRAPCVKAAECRASGVYVCAGRFRKVAGGKIITNYGDQDLRDFLDNCEQVGSDVIYVPRGPTATWESLFQKRLTPRVIVGPGVQDTISGLVISNKPVWGEDCTNVQHFDCLGFISYVLNHTTKKYFNSPHLWIGAISDYHRITDEVSMADPPVPGDLLFRGEPSKEKPGEMTWHHIGFLYKEGDIGKVVQAEMAVTGVHDTEHYHPDHWTSRRRLSDEYLP
jgi:hypothetical protein